MPRTPVHPGEILAEQLETLGMSAAALGRAIKVPANRIAQIISGKRNVTADTALRLARYFNMSAEFWLGLQQQYELETVRMVTDRDLRAIRPLRSEDRAAY